MQRRRACSAHASSTHKIPTANNAPAVFNTRLFDGNAEGSIHRSKSVGGPPMLLPLKVLFAIRVAVSAAGGHRIEPDSAPATPEAILRTLKSVD